MKIQSSVRFAAAVVAVLAFPPPRFSFDWLLTLPPKTCAVVSNEIEIKVVPCAEKPKTDVEIKPIQ